MVYSLQPLRSVKSYHFLLHSHHKKIDSITSINQSLPISSLILSYGAHTITHRSITKFYHESDFQMSVIDLLVLYRCLSVGSRNTNCHIHPYYKNLTSPSDTIPALSDRTGSARGYRPPYLGRLMQCTCIKFPIVWCQLKALTT